MNTKVFYSHGKLLITAEYVVLDNALALALPTKKGQYLSVKSTLGNSIIWKSYDEDSKIWFETEISYPIQISDQNSTIENTLIDILKTAQQLNSRFLEGNKGYLITTHLTFNKSFGLGSSSTLIANIAKWANVNPFKLLQKSFGGSGYDIACANSNSPITYQLNEKNSIVNSISFNPDFSNQIYFVYLNQKQDSKAGIKHYRGLNIKHKDDQIKQINKITKKLINCESLLEFNKLITLHENIISTLIETEPVSKTLFKDYSNGSIKSLGAWGGDFIMVTVNKEDDLTYFIDKGYTTIISFKNLIL